MVTSTLPEEGVSVIADNLACALAEMDKKTVLLDMNEAETWNRYLKGSCGLDDILTEDPATGFWRIENSGNTVGSGAGKETGAFSVPGNMKKLMDALRERFDFVVIDTLPCSRMSEASQAAECSDTVVYVIRQDYAKSYRIRDSLEDICSYGVSLAGCVLNQAQVGGLSGYGYGSYGRYYGGYAYGRYGYGRYGYGRYGTGSYGRGNYGHGQDEAEENTQIKTEKKGAGQT